MVPTVVRPPLIRLVSCSRFSTKVCMGLTAWCSESISSGAVCLSPSVASSRICAPARIGAPGPRSTSCTEETAKTLLGTTRAVAVLGMDLAYCGLRLMCTKLG
ncbi:Uncharacterised protein [Mycobacteroides abscessus subsp. abscessus]|nr:Uncharacterised protein [Mycobacteroides abscessus subsp. abscessus]